jgi:alkylation response protein AidB-like acyl-CoA dehydrogenase
VHFDFSFEQCTLADSVGRFLRSLPTITQSAPYPYEPRKVLEGLVELGLFGENSEGSPLGFADSVAISIEAGRSIVAAPVTEAIAIAVSLSRSRGELATRLAAGDVPGVAVSGCLARRGAQVSGEAVITHGQAADFLFVPVDGEGGRDWMLLDPSISTMTRIDTMDITGDGARVRIDGLSAPVAGNGDDAAAMDRAVRLLALAEIVGAADACLARTVAYIGERKQFGKPIGSYQAVKHMAADCAVSLEAMKAAVEYAGWALDAASEDAAAAEEAALSLWSAASYVGEHGKRVAERCVQMHGGIAFTWDYGLHVPLRRILFRTATLAAVRDGREDLAAHLID